MSRSARRALWAPPRTRYEATFSPTGRGSPIRFANRELRRENREEKFIRPGVAHSRPQLGLLSTFHVLLESRGAPSPPAPLPRRGEGRMEISERAVRKSVARGARAGAVACGSRVRAHLVESAPSLSILLPSPLAGE